MMSATFSLVLSLVALCTAQQATFEGYELLSFDVKDAREANHLRELGEQYPELDFWLEPVPGRRSNVLVPPPLLSEVKSRLVVRGLPYQVAADDVQAIVDAGTARTPVDEAERKRATGGYIIDHTNYHNYTQILSYISQLKQRYSQNVAYWNMGKTTYQKRGVVVVKITGDGNTSDRPAIVIEAGIHAREWISPAANLYFLEKLLRDYKANDATAKQMLNTYNWYLVPVANPDGYEYSIHRSRMWRKNRSAHPTSYFCVGIDLNRNFDSKFRQVGVSSNCHSDIYPGITAFSEAETQNLRDLVVDRKDKVVAYLGVHAYSQFLMVSWGNVLGNSRPHNYVEIDRVGKKMQSALEGHGFRYEYGTVYQLLDYAASGASMDWVLEAKPNMYSYAYELRPDQRSNDGFNLPPRYIVSQGEEYFDSLAVMAKEMSVCRAGSGYEQCQSHAVVG